MAIEIIPKIPAVKTGVQFLASSHFKIGKDPHFLAAQDATAYLSTFKKDYPIRGLEYTVQAELPPKAQIFCTDNRQIVWVPVTQRDFVPLPYGRRDFSNCLYALSKTNFKMECDDRIKTFQTTNSEYYEPNLPVLRSKKILSLDWKKSHISQGDREKEPWPESHYKSKFLKSNLAKRKSIVNTTFYGENPIKGDLFNLQRDALICTSVKSYPEHNPPVREKIPDYVKYPPVSIPCGDPDKCSILDSNNQRSYTEKKSLDGLYDRSEALRMLQRTTFRDGDYRLKGFEDESKKLVIPHKLGQTEVPAGLKSHRNSEYPEDTSSCSRDRCWTTSNEVYFSKPPGSVQHAVVNGSQLRTLSNVNFGGDHSVLYKTTMQSSFPTLKTGHKMPGRVTSDSSTPILYSPIVLPSSSYRHDFRSRNAGSRLLANPEAMENLKRSHIVAPTCDLKQFTTTHQGTYTCKPNIGRVFVNASRMHSSSVPLGTLTS